MPLFEAVRLALSQLRVQKLKSFFALLGVMIGVMFLIAVVAIVEGLGRYMERDVVGMTVGANTFELRRFPMRNFGNVSEETWREWQRRPRIRDQDVAAVAEALPEGVRWAVQSISWEIPVESPHARPQQLQLYAVDGDYFRIQNMKIASGRIIAPQELAMGTPVVVLGDQVATHFFPNLDPLGRNITIGGTRFRVVGVAQKQGSMFGMSLDKFAVTPINSPARRAVGHPPGAVGAMIVQGPNLVEMHEALDVARQVMRGRHNLRPTRPDDFALETSQAAAEFMAKIRGVMLIAGTVLPAIGLIVGAMVIMNIMLMAVSERTREIGIRKSLGARRRDIMWQFLVESATVSTIGAAMGVTLGALMAVLIATYTPLPTAVAPWSVIAAVLMGAGVGIVAGIYPARRASRLDPINAMRQET